MAQARQGLFRDFVSGANASDLSLAHARLFDDYFRHRLSECATTDFPFAVVAVGGYGRSELCAHSDIDVLVLVKGDIPPKAKGLAKALFFPLWDMSLDLGHGVRDIGECLALADKDLQVFASLLDARFLAGDQTVFEDFLKGLDQGLPGREQAFKDWLATQNIHRFEVYGDASGMLEPHLKEGLGGLRDCHQIRWLARLTGGHDGTFLQGELGLLAGQMEFLLRVRNHLHLISSRRMDRLGLDAQPELARRLGFAGTPEVLPVEAFLAELHRVMAEILALRRTAWSILAKDLGWRRAPSKPLDGYVRLTEAGLDFVPGWTVEKNPLSILDIFGHALSRGAPLSLMAKRGVAQGERSLSRLAASYEGGKRIFEFLMRVLVHPAGGDVLRDMLDTGVLGAVLPEFHRVRHMVQYDMYHVHPVGRHTLETILEIKRAAEPDHAYHEIYQRLAHPERLLLGALFHDIGKGLGGSHSEKGAEIARGALERLGQDEALISDVCFLVLSHLQLADTATRRDLSDEDILAACASRVGTTDRLDMLFLLTMADSLATGPSAWNSWKSGLIGELYLKIRAVLEGGGLFDSTDAQKMLAVRDKVRVKGRSILDAPGLEARLDAMPPRYLLNRPLEDILGDLAMVVELEDALEEDYRQRPSHRAGLGVAQITTKPAPKGGGWTVTLAAKHHPDLFPAMAGVLALHDINIRSADFHLWRDNIEIHCYHTDSPPDTLYIEELWARVRRALRYALTGKLSLDFRIREKLSSPLSPKSPDMGLRAQVLADNATSRYYTILEVRAGDRIGLLYDIALALQSLGLQVHLAKIDTQGLAVRDVFYVRDAQGLKIQDQARIDGLSRTLTERIGASGVDISSRPA